MIGSNLGTMPKLDQLGFEPRAFRMRSGCDTTTPLAQLQYQSNLIISIETTAALAGAIVTTIV